MKPIFLQRLRLCLEAALHPAAQVLRWHSRLLMRLVLAVAAILLILAALWQFWFIPRLEHYRPMLVAEFSRATGMQVQIRELGAGWDGVRPRLSLRGVQVSDPAGQAALQFAGLEGALSWWILPLGELHFSRITLDAPELSVSKRKDGRWQVAGVVLIRQRPSSAKGVCFITLEDETGVVNLVIWPDLMEKQRKVIMGARLMEVTGRVEYDDEVIHVIAIRLTDATAALHGLSEDRLPDGEAATDSITRPLSGSRGGHPRDVQIIPRSRDFH